MWKQSRHQIDNAIQTLKQRLERLKEIRRHLKHTKPALEDKQRILNTTENSTSVSVINPISNLDLFSVSTTERNIFENYTEEYFDVNNTTTSSSLNGRTLRRKGKDKTRRKLRLDVNETNIDYDRATLSMLDLFNLTTESPRIEVTTHRPIR